MTIFQGDYEADLAIATTYADEIMAAYKALDQRMLLMASAVITIRLICKIATSAGDAIAGARSHNLGVERSVRMTWLQHHQGSKQ